MEGDARFAIGTVERLDSEVQMYGTLEEAKQSAQQQAAEEGEEVIVLKVLGSFQSRKTAPVWQEVEA